ncbi:TetR/AcrR family transcriptional regulator [Phycicoccus endophyticus]|uniref:TetR/AcrR family transcriptional regulator n=1 Tax=Phycicoccus endophyticus TaxID=1690220 RepID=UPI00197B42F3|nr:TetR/AcrR family transcriptional regulator [Phycicoccus endophyticus]GGL37310.1 TetR family transcriptional regulator [Phycicoccus endophyticus]
MSRRTPGRPPETTRAQIRHVAVGLFTTHGYDRTSMADVARAVGVSRSTVFNYFPSKRDLLAQDLPDIERRVVATLEAGEDLPVLQALTAAIVAGVALPRAEHDAMAARWGVVRSVEELRAHHAAGVERLSAGLVGAVRARTTADPARVAEVVRALIAVADSVTRSWAEEGTPAEDLDVVMRARLAPFAEALAPLLEGPPPPPV